MLEYYIINTYNNSFIPLNILNADLKINICIILN